MSPEFIDTNVLLYAYSPADGERHARAAELVQRLADSRQAAISVQVMQEFYVNATGKIARPIAPEEAMRRLRALSLWYVYSPLPGDVMEAARLGQRHRLSFWDAMVVLSAVRLKCAVLWTEDLNHGQMVEGVRIANPFLPAPA